MLHRIVTARLLNVIEANQITLDVRPRVGDGVTHTSLSSKVHHHSRLMLLKDLIDERLIRKVDRFVEKGTCGELRRTILIGLITITLLVCCSCSSTKAVTQQVRDVRTDTVYLSNMQYNSIYVYRDRLLDRSKDTVYLKDVSVEYRYRLLKDTVRIVERDSIPYEVTVTKVKEIKSPLTWFDYLCRICFGICFSGFLIVLYKFIRFFRLGGILNN